MKRDIIMTITNGEEGVESDIFTEIDKFCIEFNKFGNAMFFYLKFIFAFMLIILGIYTLRKYRGFWRDLKFKEEKLKERGENVSDAYIMLGIFYLFLGFGILLGYLTLILIVLLDPLPDKFMFNFLEIWISDDKIEGIKNYEEVDTPFERTVYYIISFVSFLGFMNLIMGLRFMILYSDKTHVTSLRLFLMGLVVCVLMGFTTFMPLFL